MRIPSGKTDQYIYFVAVDSTDLKTRETGLSSFTVYRSRNGSADTLYTTPTISEIDATNMPGVYALLVDEDTTIASGSDSEEYCVHITQASMAPVTRTVELYRRTATTGVAVGLDSSGRVDVGMVRSVTPIIDAGGSITVNATGSVNASVPATKLTGTIALDSSGRVNTGLIVGVTPLIDATGSLTVNAQGSLANRISATLVPDASGRVVIGSIAAGAVGSLAYSADGITRIQAGLALSNQIAGTLVPDASGRVVVGSFAAGSLGSLVLAADGVTRIQSGLATANQIGSGGTIALDASGRVTTGSITAGAVGSLVFAADGITRIQAGLALAADLATVDTVVDGITAKITGTFLMVAGGSLVIDGGGVLALEATAQLIKAKTDSLTFTVANNLNANIHYVNDVAVTGTGAAGDEWGP